MTENLTSIHEMLSAAVRDAVDGAGRGRPHRLAGARGVCVLARPPQRVAIAVGAAAGNGRLASCEVRAHRFAANAGQAFTVAVNASSASRVQGRKAGASGLASAAIAATSQPLPADKPRLANFIIPAGSTYGAGDDPTLDPAGTYRIGGVAPVAVRREDQQLRVDLHGVEYQGFPVARGVHYVPGLDAHLRFAGTPQGNVSSTWDSVFVAARSVKRIGLGVRR